MCTCDLGISTLGHLVECLLLTDAISKGVLLTPTGGKLGSALTDSYTGDLGRECHLPLLRPPFTAPPIAMTSFKEDNDFLNALIVEVESIK